MNIHNVLLTVSAVNPNQYPDTPFPDLAFAGRSNVGKSSFINKVLGRKSLARTSSKPGETATINFYNIDDCLNFVDLPGYGYAKVSERGKEKVEHDDRNVFKKQTHPFAGNSDCRQPPRTTENDAVMLNFIRAVCGRAVVVASKLDKLKNSERDDALRRVISTLRLCGDDIIIPFSAVTGEGADMFWDYVNTVIMGDSE